MLVFSGFYQQLCCVSAMYQQLVWHPRVVLISYDVFVLPRLQRAKPGKTITP